MTGEEMVKELGGAWVLDRIHNQIILLKHPASDQHWVRVAVEPDRVSAQVYRDIPTDELEPTLRNMHVTEHLSFFVGCVFNPTESMPLIEAVRKVLALQIGNADRARAALAQVAKAVG